MAILIHDTVIYQKNMTIILVFKKITIFCQKVAEIAKYNYKDDPS
jgi:hypothetical protein